MEIYVQYPWQIALFALLAIVLFAYLMYRREDSLHPALRFGLAGVRVCILMLMVLLLLQPMVRVEEETTVRGYLPVLIDVSESMEIRDTRKNTEDIVEAAVALGKIPWRDGMSEEELTEAAYASHLSTKEQREEISMTPRNALVEGIFKHSGLDVFDRLSEAHNVRYFIFAERLQAIESDGGIPEVLSEGMPQSSGATRLGDALEAVVNRYAGSPVSGVVLISDGASTSGTSPEKVAHRLKKLDIPLHTVGVGLPEPSDVAIRDLILKDVVFTRDLVSAKVRLVSNGYEKRTVTLRATLDDAEVARKSVVLEGGSQFEKLEFQAKRVPGRARLRIEVSPLSGEATHANNKMKRTLRVIDDRIKVLYVEGSPRWEYRYLRAILKRDRRLEVTFLVTEGDKTLAKASPDHIDAFPTAPRAAFDYDLIIIGDAPAATFQQKQLKRIEELVRDRGGSLMMIAGEDHAPTEYTDTPIARLLPVRVGDGGGHEVSQHMHPVLTSAGRESMVMTLQSSKRRNDARWARVKPLGWLPRVVGIKRGAQVLARLSDPAYGLEEYPLVAWQRYGSGKSMFISTDRLWRLRYEVGDKYHTRFWIQAVQFLGLSRLLGENKRVRIETDKSLYDIGQAVHISAHALNAEYEPLGAPACTVNVRRVKGGQPVPVRLKRVPETPGLFHSVYVPRQTGRYAVAGAKEGASRANTAEFDVRKLKAERTETAMQEDLLMKMASMTGGSYGGLLDLPDLESRIKPREETATVTREYELWDTWIVMILFLMLVGCEWVVRRLHGLA